MISTRPAKARSLLRLAWFLFFITTTLHSAPLKVGAHDKPPFCFKNPDGSWTGLSVEVWKEVAARAGLEYELVEVPFEMIRKGVASGTLDLGIGEITVTECEMINQFKGSATVKPQFTRGYGLGFGQCERKVMSMALVDRSLRAGELGEERMAPAQDEEFVLSHSDNVQATGFVEHLKLPHYVDFQSELVLLRRLRAEIDGAKDRLEAAE